MNYFESSWKFLDQLLLDLKVHKKTEIKISAGLPYLCVRLALLKKSLIILSSEDNAEWLAQDTRALASLFPALENYSIRFVPEEDPLQVSALIEESIQQEGILWFATTAALNQPLFTSSEFLQKRMRLKVGQVLKYSDLLTHLSHHGYKRVDLVEEVGQFAARGEIFDVWSPNTHQPTRIVYSLDTLESMHAFDLETQRSTLFIPEQYIVPIINLQFQSLELHGKLKDYFPENIIGLNPLIDIPLDLNESTPLIQVHFEGLDSGTLRAETIHHQQWNLFYQSLEKKMKAGLKNFVFCRNMGEIHRLEDILDSMRCPLPLVPQMFPIALHQGFVNEELKLAVWSFNELMDLKPILRRESKFKIGRVLDTISEIKTGDYVVHEKFGIGRYKGLERISIQIRKKGYKELPIEKVSEFLVLEYKNNDRLLVPIQDFRMVQRYVGQDGKKPQLYSLDGAAWERVKQRVKEEVIQVAEEILKTAANRATVVRPVQLRQFDSVSGENLFQEFIEAFPYEETPDQLAASAEVVEDMQSGKLMDRLICGDVGYGKTEIAMRAAFRAVCDYHQVAVLVPTTILAEQHYKTFTDRFAAFPVRIEFLSRFQTASEQKIVIENLKNGITDIVIGTHRLLQKDISFKQLGLIIIDEEHRFGVQQKETMKQLKLTADMLSLSATPIPRTLSLSLGGVRDISIIETPPQGRLPIQTISGLFSEKTIQEAITRELARHGQVFYVHNRIASIEKTKQMLETLIPGICVGIAHGQMSADDLEQAMWNFLHKKWDVLIATTIIESGLDIPSVNTLIIEEAQDFGLSQLYQLRGRVGRQREKAYCYLFFSGWSNLTEEARKRMEAIQEFSALGSGIQLAMRDMEIRGTGNFLGHQQHGWINAVGLDMYCQMLSDEVQNIREQQNSISAPVPMKIAPPTNIDTEINLNLSAYIPDDYVQSSSERIVLYKKVNLCSQFKELEQLKIEFVDRFGHLPEPVKNLFAIVDCKIQASPLKIFSITEVDRGIVLSWKVIRSQIPIRFVELAQAHATLVEILPPDPTDESTANLFSILYKDKKNSDVFTLIKKILQITSQYVILPTL